MKHVMKISTVAFHAIWGKKELNLQRMLDYIELAAGEGEIPAQLPVLLLCHADGEISAIVPHRSAGPDLIPHGDSPPSAGRKTALPPGPDVPQRTAIPPLCHRRC